MARKRWKRICNTECILSDHTSTSLIHTSIFPHADSQTLREADEELGRGKKKYEEGKRIFPFVHIRVLHTLKWRVCGKQGR